MCLPVFSSSVWADSDQEEEDVDEEYKDDNEDEGMAGLHVLGVLYISANFYCYHANFQYRYRQLQYRFVVIFEAPSRTLPRVSFSQKFNF